MYVVYADFAPQVWWNNEFRFMLVHGEPSWFDFDYLFFGSSESVWLVPGTAEE